MKARAKDKTLTKDQELIQKHKTSGKLLVSDLQVLDKALTKDPALESSIKAVCEFFLLTPNANSYGCRRLPRSLNVLIGPDAGQATFFVIESFSEELLEAIEKSGLSASTVKLLRELSARYSPIVEAIMEGDTWLTFTPQLTISQPEKTPRVNLRFRKRNGEELHVEGSPGAALESILAPLAQFLCTVPREHFDADEIASFGRACSKLKEHLKPKR